ncbi:MAG TPA: SigE family RNA polymerase sigma factor [Mycobacteriales bacterium]|nr:SigE family RNA polymerase sigma factor [Mycobacteriales bacterium]
MDAPATDAKRDQFAQLYEVHYEPLVRLARLLTTNRADAEDLVQTAFVQTYRRGPLRDPDLAGAYVRRCLINGARSRWRREQIAKARLPLISSTNYSDPDLTTPIALRHALAQLPRREREAVALRYYGDMSESATAAAMGVSVGSVKGYTSRGLQHLGELLGRTT